MEDILAHQQQSSGRGFSCGETTGLILINAVPKSLPANNSPCQAVKISGCITNTAQIGFEASVDLVGPVLTAFGTLTASQLIAETVKITVANAGSTVFRHLAGRVRDNFVENIQEIRPTFPYNHDIIRAIRSSWLSSLLFMLQRVPLASNTSEFDDAERLRAQIEELSEKLQTEKRDWQKADSLGLTWTGLSVDQIQDICTAARAEASSLEARKDYLENTDEAVSMLALTELAQYLKLDHISAINRRLRHAFQFGLHSAEGAFSLSALLRQFFLQELKDNPKANTAFILYSFNSLSSQIDTGNQFIQSSITSAIDDALAENSSLQAILELQGTLSSVHAEVSTIQKYMDDIQDFQKTDREISQKNRDDIIAALDKIIREDAELKSNVSDELAKIRTLVRQVREGIDVDPQIGWKLRLSTKPNVPTADARRAAIAATPTWALVNARRFFDRHHLLDAATICVSQWYQEDIDLKIPVMWIEGRHGDGKSVFLLQLAHRIISATPDQAIYQVDADKLFDWLVWTTKRDQSLPAPIALIDDLTSLIGSDKFLTDIERLVWGLYYSCEIDHFGIVRRHRTVHCQLQGEL